MTIRKSNPYLSLVNSYLIDSPQPSSINYWWNLGVRRLTIICCVIIAVYNLVHIVIYELLTIAGILSNKYILRIADSECAGKGVLGHLVASASSTFYAKANKLDTYKRNHFSNYILTRIEGYNWRVISLVILDDNINYVSSRCFKQEVHPRVMTGCCMQVAKESFRICMIINILCFYNISDIKFSYEENRLSKQHIMGIRDETAYQETNILTRTRRVNSNCNNIIWPRNRLPLGINIIWPPINKGGITMKWPSLKMKEMKQTNFPQESNHILYDYLGKKKSNLDIKRLYSNSAIDKKDTQIVLNKIFLDTKLKNDKYYNLLPIITDKNFLIESYNRIKSNPGNMTKGTDSITLDGINEEYFIKLSKELKSGKFNFKPGRSVDIPKKEPGKFRTLIVMSPRDKIVQRALTTLLTLIFDPLFSTHSHGFRPGKSTHTALANIYLKGSRFNWVIQGDIHKCFDEIPHKIIINEISKKLGDPALINLIRKYLQAGFILNGKIVKPTKGTPQGGILSPLLANIVLDVFDKYLEKYTERYKKGIKKRTNPEYQRLMNKLNSINNKRILNKITNKEEYQECRRLVKSSSSVIHKDDSFRRMMFVRYADDFVILVNGPLNEAKLIKLHIKEFIKTHCGLNLNEDKTTITNISKKWYFLGAEIVKPIRTNFEVARGNSKMRITKRMFIKAPIDKLINKLLEQGFIRRNKLGELYPLHKGNLINLDHYSIISFYSSKIRGIVNYYSFASNYNRLRWIIWHLQSSCAYTLAAKFKTTNLKIFKKYGKRLTCPETEVGLWWPDHLKATHIFRNKSDLADPFKLLEISWSSKLTTNTFNKVCVLCSSSQGLEMHHLRKVADVRYKMRTGNSTFEQWIGASTRKQIPLCKYHHIELHKGNLNPADISIIRNFNG